MDIGDKHNYDFTDSGPFCRRGGFRRILPNELLHAQRACPVSVRTSSDIRS